MENNHPGTSIVTIFGAAGDLTWRKLMPALYNLHLDKLLPQNFAVFGIDKKPMSKGEFHEQAAGRRQPVFPERKGG